jgi:hypothetical protein
LEDRFKRSRKEKETLREKEDKKRYTMTTKRCRCLDKLTPVKLKELRFKEMTLLVELKEMFP